MFEGSISEILGYKSCRMTGRLDSLTASDAHRLIDELVAGGQRTIIVDLEQLHYVSSAGLRVFLLAQKVLQKVGGRLVIFKPADSVRQIFQLSGFTNLFDIVSDLAELENLLGAETANPASHSRELGGIRFNILEQPANPGSFLAFGDQEKLSRAEYTLSDVVQVSANHLTFGVGLGAFGQNYDDYKNFFGEAVVINGSLFYYPAIPRAGVDFVLNLSNDQPVKYNFLHGFGFSGNFKIVSSFETLEGLVDLSRLISACLQICPAKGLGIVLLAESKGLWGMNLKKVPIVDNQPGKGLDIFHSDIFKDWISFPVEPGDTGHIFLGVGLAVPDRAQASAKFQPWLGRDSNFHMHAAVFAKGPLGKKPEQLPEELRRVITEIEVLKVQHLLGRSKLAAGMAGLIELEA